MLAQYVGGFFAVLIIGAVIFGIIVSGAVGLGWLLTQIISSFSLFEGTLVAMIALICTTLIMANIVVTTETVGPAPDGEDRVQDRDEWENYSS